MSAIPFFCSNTVFLAAACLHEIHLAGVSFDPVVSLVLLVREYRRWGLFVDAGSHGQAAGSGADDDHIMDINRWV